MVPALDREVLATYLARRLPDDGEVVVADLVRFPRGVSRETWFVRALTREGEREERLVIRRDLSSGSVCPTTLRFEYEVYRRLAGTGVPIAPVRWYEDDPEALPGGRELYVRDEVDGSWEIPGLTDPDPRFDELRVAVSKEHLRALARVHSLDWDALGFGEIMEVPASPEACALAAIDRLERTLERLRVEPLPVLTEAVHWLREHVPRDAPCVALLKGTNGLGEEVFSDGRIVAMSDWELASLGDPASDFAHLQDLVPGLVPTVDVPWAGVEGWGLDEALAFYEEVGGVPVTHERIAFYQLLTAFETAVLSHHAAVPLVRGHDRSARLAWVSTEVFSWAQYVLAVGTGIVTSPSALVAASGAG
ncbi:MAG: phosphotransferase family protein [Acidimicrobiia bacterium]|nr:phosphotransferase family protein [Acidimicrobiia bacterium]